MNKHLIITTLLLSVLTASIFFFQSAAPTNAKVTVSTNKTFKKTSFLSNTNKPVYVWNATLTKKRHNLKNYPRTNLYSTKRVTIKTNHYFGSYYYVHSANNKIKGYVWHNHLIQGTCFKGGFYRYPTLNVLLSNRPYRKGTGNSGMWNASGVYSSATRIHGILNKDGLQKFSKVPALKQQKVVLNYLKKSRPYLPKMIEYGNHNGARITMKKVYYEPFKWVRIPMIEILNGNATSGNWEEINTFSAVLDLTTLPNGAKPIATYNVNKTSVIPFGGRQFDFADPTPQFATYANGPIIHIYGNGFGPKHNLSLVDLNRWLRYVPTRNILKLSNTRPTLKNGIWYVAPTYQDNVSYDAHSKKILTQIDSSKSQYYRFADASGFTQYHYENGKWHGQYQVKFNSPDFNKGNQVSMTFANMITKSDGNDTWLSPTNEHVIKTFPGNDSEVLPYLYKSVSYYDTFLNNQN
ncbi:hypothetical protein [Lentilactobacillus farraginis]|uniref:D-alanyl-D-alanine carboxypeptidase n=1 Tax=Lentilactobacillus farraginis DSM 18382 = JCM 14108 TaxID=1423743 RepID=X0PGR8_9LACO|nr:hypothetical protein [Lentilactobacillus farraginis]KRM11046.1 hypothetical protein FD41_GL001654 [Lentilactobacillus farraginis DSM 18382 = JCM 14108]GAF35576.1 D-alanyl-D-alanine carboxypeptidase [Lentilactobacillus farraginis DSM 18382 = JCM 14108]